MGVGCFEGGDGLEILGGGTDGVVRVWEGVGSREGACERDWEWRAHDDPIGSTVLHPSGTVVATCSGQRAEPIIKDDSASDDSDENTSGDESVSDSLRSQSMIRKATGRAPDNSLKVWSLT
ncbi:hypothetical protein DID88_010449 [Monilinia fructigena]|uniref:Anaphase-promoting complex subunit 4 WD40 domain-containing protein n=1 Tax=Monilinia fructigena TaxID=38457 RepID=A0A395ILG0_9HELO|nr:hypothetical protein DID88_010449 [Monilinia fructigena]